MFTGLGGAFTLDKDDLTKSPSVVFTVNVASVATANKKRDGHLQSADFFNAKNWTELKFTSSEVVKTGDNTYKAVGTLQIRDVKKPFEVPFTLLGVQKVKAGLMSSEVMGIRVKTELNRNDFGVDGPPPEDPVSYHSLFAGSGGHALADSWLIR